MGIGVRNMLIIFEIGIDSLMLVGHPYKKNKMLQMHFFIHFFCEVELTARNYSMVLPGRGSDECCPYS